jgi:formylglycine-generating enzyme required for sulfatase activity
VTIHKKYDVFLSYSRTDETAVKELAATLRARGFEVFLDQWNLVPGEDWQTGLEQALRESCTCAVCLGSEPGPWQNKEMRLALSQGAKQDTFRVIPVLLSESRGFGEPPLDGFLGLEGAVDFRQGLDDQESLENLVRGIAGVAIKPGEEAEVSTPLTHLQITQIQSALRGLEVSSAGLDGPALGAIEGAKKELTKKLHTLQALPKVRVRGVSARRRAVGKHSEEIAAYYRALAADCKRLPLGIIDTRFISTAGEDAVVLPDIYVDLDVVTPASELSEEEEGKAPEEKARRWAQWLSWGEGRGRTSLLEAVADHQRVVLLGDAGAGKTTFAHYLTYLLATREPLVSEPLRGLFPVRLILRDVAARHIPADADKGTGSMLWSALEEDLKRRLQTTDANGIFHSLRHLILNSGGFFLLDGLDEVPEAHRRRRTLLEAVIELAAELGPGSRVLVTARPYAYADPSWQLGGFSTLSLAPLNEDQADRFVRCWYEAVRESLHWSIEEAEQRAQELAGVIRERPHLGDLASRPLLLTLMATVHSSWGRLPEDRADLYEEVVQLLLGRWQRWRKATAPNGEEITEPGISQTLQVGEEAIRARLDHLAFLAHERQRTEESEREDSADISETEVLTVFKPLLDNVGPSKLLDYLRHRAGLLIERREGVYAFPHRSFQEYLTASYLAGRPDADLELRQRAHEDPLWWREVFLLAAGKTRKGGLSRAAGMIRAMLPTPVQEQANEGELQWRLVALAGEALVELRLLERAGEDLPTYEGQFVGEVRNRLANLISGGHLPPSERLVAGDALSRLGDPRPGVGVVMVEGTELPDLEWIELPAGTFTIGSEVKENEQPLHAVKLPRFYLTRYPITNAQYRPFVEAGGYQQRELWSREGWLWRTGEDLDLSTVEESRSTWDFLLQRRPAARRIQPLFYGDSLMGAPSRPVLVSWFEAVAYTRWLQNLIQKTRWWKERSATLGGFGVELPSEIEWERAARGNDGRRWPWGNEFDVRRTNTREARLGQTSPVGMFPTGRNPAGLDELAGNVLEWTRSLYRSYPYDSTDGRESVAGFNKRVVRGGCWLSEQLIARCTQRSRMTEVESEIVGFRCAIAPAT